MVVAKKAKKSSSSDANRKLLAAIAADDLKKVRAALGAGADPSVRNGKYPAVAVACREGKQDEIIFELLAAGADLAALRGELAWAIHCARPDLVGALLEFGADVNSHSRHGIPLHAAAQLGNVELIRRLISAGADVNFQHPLMAAINANQSAAACALIEAGADLSDRANEIEGQTLLNYVVMRDDAQILQALIRAGADVNQPGLIRNSRDIKLLRSLRPPGDPECEVIETVFHPGADSPLRNQLIGRERHTMPPLILAAALGRAESVTLLLKGGANPTTHDGIGATAYEWAADLGHRDVLRLLDKTGAPTRVASPGEQLLVAADKGDVRAIQRLLGQIAAVDVRDERDATKNRTPLMLAAAKGHLDVVKALLAAGADPNLTDNPSGKTARGFQFMLREGGRDFLGQSGCLLGQTALMFAAHAGHTEVVRALVEAGAKVNAADHAGWTALDVATAADHAKTVQALAALGAKPGKGKPAKTR
jgi:ankyrin repeat protein